MFSCDALPQLTKFAHSAGTTIKHRGPMRRSLSRVSVVCIRYYTLRVVLRLSTGSVWKRAGATGCRLRGSIIEFQFQRCAESYAEDVALI